MTGLFDGAEVISVYTAEQAVDDGILVQVPGSTSRRVSNGVYGNDLCFSAPVRVTTNLWSQYIEGEEDNNGLERLLQSVFESFKNGDPQDLMRTDIRYASHRPPVTVWAVIDGDGLCVMLPEDY